MAIYLKKFETQAAYEAAQSSLILPNVSLIEENNGVAYKPYVDPYAGHEYVDLGLPSGTKWATMNVGASSEEDDGNYYGYGKGISQYSETSAQTYYQGSETPLAASADTATQVWGGLWHMPTLAQLNELTANTTCESNYIGSKSGYKFTAQNGNYIFIPEAGYYRSETKETGLAMLWTSTPYVDQWNSDAYAVNLSGTYPYPSVGIYISKHLRTYGFSIRPVVG